MSNELHQGGILEDRPQIKTNKKIREAGEWEFKKKKNIFGTRKFWYSQRFAQLSLPGTENEPRV